MMFISCTPCSPLLPHSLQENYDGETIDFYAPIPRAAYSCQPFAAHAACNKIFALSYPDPRNGIPSSSSTLCLQPPQAIPIERPLPFWEPALAAVFGLVFGPREEIGVGLAWADCSCRRRFFCLLLGNFVCTFSQLPTAHSASSFVPPCSCFISFRSAVYIVTVAAFFALQVAFTVGFYVCILCI